MILIWIAVFGVAFILLKAGFDSLVDSNAFMKAWDQREREIEQEHLRALLGAFAVAEQKEPGNAKP